MILALVRVMMFILPMVVMIMIINGSDGGTGDDNGTDG